MRHLALLALPLLLAACGSAPTAVRTVEWRGEGVVSVATDNGKMSTSLEYLAGISAETGAEYHCPFVRIESDIMGVHWLVFGVPPAHEDAPLDPLCYEKFGHLAIRSQDNDHGFVATPNNSLSVLGDVAKVVFPIITTLFDLL